MKKTITIYVLVVLLGASIFLNINSERQRGRLIQHQNAWDARDTLWALNFMRKGELDKAIAHLEGRVTRNVQIARQWDLEGYDPTSVSALTDTYESLQAVKLYFDKTRSSKEANDLLSDVPLSDRELAVRRFDAAYRGTGRALPELAVSDWNDEAVTLGSLRGKVVLLDFWGTWCAPCIKGMPFVQELYEKYGDKGVVVLAIHCGAQSEKAFAFVELNNYSFPTAIDSGETTRKYRVLPRGHRQRGDHEEVRDCRIPDVFPC